MHYIKLIKLMYLADREALLRWGVPITRDRYVSMDNGPVLSRVLNLITEDRPKPVWSQFISAPLGEYEVMLLREAPTDSLSRAEEKLLDETFQKYGHRNRWDLIDNVMHKLPEWQNPNKSTIPIQLREILKAGGESEEDIRDVLRELHAFARDEEKLTRVLCLGAGTPFLQATAASQDNFHLWIIVTPPTEGEVVTVCMVTATRKTEKLVSLEPSDHPFIRHKSAISYGFSKIRMIADVEALLANGSARAKEPMPPNVLSRIVAGVIDPQRSAGYSIARSWASFRRIIGWSRAACERCAASAAAVFSALIQNVPFAPQNAPDALG